MPRFARPGTLKHKRRAATELRIKSTLAAQTDAETPDLHVFANPYYWAPFALVAVGKP